MGASATSGVKCGMFKSGPSEPERGLALMDCKTQTGQSNKGPRRREMEEVLLLLVFRCGPTPGRGVPTTSFFLQ